MIGGGGLIVQVDPDQTDSGAAARLYGRARSAGVAAIWVGGSFLHQAGTKSVVSMLVRKRRASPSGPPVFAILGFSDATALLVPGLDGVLVPLLGTLTAAGRLVEQAWRAGPALAALGRPVIPLGYVLVDTGSPTSASHVLQGPGAPAMRPDTVTALVRCAWNMGAAGVFVDAGSGGEPMPAAAIRAAVAGRSGRAEGRPLVVGGGLRDAQAVSRARAAGADAVVVGTRVEEDGGLDALLSLAAAASGAT